MDEVSAAIYESGPARAMVYTADPDASGVLRQALNGLSTPEAQFRLGGVSEALKDFKERPSPTLLVVDTSGEADPVARVRELVNCCDPSTSILVLGEINDIRLYRNILQAGARDYFFKPLVTALVGRACRAIMTGEDEADSARTGRLVCVIGVRGGCGATSIATRIAWRLSEAPRSVLLLDLDLQCGDSAMQFDVVPGHALSEALAQPERVDDLFLERGLIHITKRLDLLASLEPLSASARYDESAVLSLLERVLRRYRYVVTDIPALAATEMGRVLHMPGTLLLVSDGRLVSAREVARWREWLGENSAERTVLHVLNGQGAPGSLPPNDFVRVAGKAPDVVIPYAREVAANALLGLRKADQGQVMDRALDPIIAMLAGEAVRPARSLIRRILG